MYAIRSYYALQVIQTLPAEFFSVSVILSYLPLLEFVQPALDRGPVDFEMELETIGHLADAEALVAAAVSCDQQYCRRRQVEGVFMKLHERWHLGDGGKYGVGHRLGGAVELCETDFK